MPSAPIIIDPTGTVGLIGSGPAAVNAMRLLRSAGAHVRWYTDTADVAEELLLASTPPGGLELSLSDPLQADYSEFIAVVTASETVLDQRIAVRARASNVPINVVGRGDFLMFKLGVTGDRRVAGQCHATIRDIAA
jgi:uroporphyrin-III C-methyltransferase / precorrin-2 dehydrogenase / sirohydrochlorin ferrochelatase